MFQLQLLPALFFEKNEHTKMPQYIDCSERFLQVSPAAKGENVWIARFAQEAGDYRNWPPGRQHRVGKVWTTWRRQNMLRLLV